MERIILGVGDLGATKDPAGSIRTLGLGSCVALILLDPVTHCVGMDHIALPDSATNLDRAKEKPGHFANTGVPALINAMKRAGADANIKRYIVKLAGGANVMDPNNTFNIGKRNVLAIKKALWPFGLGAIAEDIGGHFSRSVMVDVATGKVVIASPGRDSWEI